MTRGRTELSDRRGGAFPTVCPSRHCAWPVRSAGLLTTSSSSSGHEEHMRIALRAVRAGQWGAERGAVRGGWRTFRFGCRSPRWPQETGRCSGADGSVVTGTPTRRHKATAAMPRPDRHLCPAAQPAKVPASPAGGTRSDTTPSARTSSGVPHGLHAIVMRPAGVPGRLSLGRAAQRGWTEGSHRRACSTQPGGY
jgi:hypothetical protein